MEKIQILAIGRDPVILQTLLRFINENLKWEGVGTVDDESAIEIFHQNKYDIAIFIDHLEEASEKKLRALFLLIIRKLFLLIIMEIQQVFLQTKSRKQWIAKN